MPTINFILGTPLLPSMVSNVLPLPKQLPSGHISPRLHPSHSPETCAVTELEEQDAGIANTLLLPTAPYYMFSSLKKLNECLSVLCYFFVVI